MSESCPLCRSSRPFLLQRTEPLAADDVLVRHTFAEAGEIVRFWGCRGCGLIFRTPRPTPEHLGHYYEQILPPLEEGIMARLGVSQELAAKRNDVRYRRLYDELKPLAGASTGHVVDIGGWDGRALLPWRAAGWQTTLLEPGATTRKLADPDIRAISSAREAAAAGLPPATLVTSYHCIEHVLDLGAWAEDARRLSSPGTLWIIEVPFELISMRGLLRKKPLPRPPVHEEHLNFFTPQSLAEVGHRMGLDVLDVKITITPYWHGPAVSLRMYARERGRKNGEASGARGGRGDALRDRARKVAQATERGFRTSLAVQTPAWRGISSAKYRWARRVHPEWG